MSEKVLTISVASYNTEKYIRKTMDSFIIPEIMDKLEVLIVNDGSSDRTLEIAQEYEARYPGTFRAIDKPNGGYGSTINKAVEVAKGRYIKTIDGDDWVDRDGLIKLINFLEKTSADMVVTNFARVNDKNGKVTPTNFEFPCEGVVKSFDEMYNNQELYMQALAIKVEIYRNNNIRITHHCFYTDIEYIMYPCPYVKSVAYLNTCVYMYRVAVNEQSMSINGKRKHIDEQRKILGNVIAYYKENLKKSQLTLGQKKYFDVVLNNMVKSHITAILSLKRCSENYMRMKTFNEFVRKEIPEIYDKGNNSAFVRLVRCNNYIIYWAESVAFCTYCKVR